MFDDALMPATYDTPPPYMMMPLPLIKTPRDAFHFFYAAACFFAMRQRQRYSLSDVCLALPLFFADVMPGCCRDYMRYDYFARCLYTHTIIFRHTYFRQPLLLSSRCRYSAAAASHDCR